MRILLINPPQGNVYKRLRGFNIKEPLGLAYIAAMLEKNGHLVKIIDAEALRLVMHEIIDEVIKFNPEMIGFTCTTALVPSIVEISKEIKKVLPNTPIIVGGAHPSSLPEEILGYDSIDISVKGEGEYIVLEIIDAIEGKKDLKDVKGISYKKDGKIIINEPRPPIMDLDSLPFPTRHLLPWEKYRPWIPLGYKIKKKVRYASVMTTRGCPFHCIFCESHEIFGRTYRGRSVDNVMKEIDYLINNFGINFISFTDDTFNFNQERVLKLCDEIKKSGYDLQWTAEMRVSPTSKQMLEKMKDAGCIFISYGVESGSDRIIKIIKKGITTDMVRNAAKLTNEVGIPFLTYFILGHPTETMETALQSINFAKELNPTHIHFTILTPWPGSEIYDNLVKEGKMKNINWEKYAHFGSSVFQFGELTSEELIKLQKRAYKEFYFRYREIKKLLPSLLSVNGIKEITRSMYYFLKFAT